MIKTRCNLIALVLAGVFIIGLALPGPVYAEGESPPEIIPAGNGQADALPGDEAPDPVPAEDLAVVVAALTENGAVLSAEDGGNIPLSSLEASQALSGTDPYLVRLEGGVNVTYRFLPDCTAYWPDTATSVCTQSSTPIQAAVDFALPGENVIIEAGIYNEDVVIGKSLLITGLGAGAYTSTITLNADISNLTSGFYAPLVFINPGGSITDGINLVTPGGTVDVAAGTYQETSTIRITKSMTLQGAGAGQSIIINPNKTYCWGPPCGPGDRTMVEIDGGNENAAGYTINVLLDGFTLDGQYAYGMKFGVLVHGGAFAGISNNTVQNFYDHAYPGGNQVNVLAGYWGQDWPWSGSAGVWHYTGHAYMHDNFVTGFNTVGMMIWGPNSTGIIENNIISPDPTDSHLSLGAMGIVLQATGDVTVSNNIITNLVTPGGHGANSWRSGMEAYWPGNTTITGNIFDGNDYGFAMYNNWGQPQGATMLMEANTFSNNDVGVQLGGMNIISFTNNSFFGNNTGVLNTMNRLVDATGNWWGASDGPAPIPSVAYLNNGQGTPTGSGDTISDYLRFDPFLTADPDPDGDSVFAPNDNCPGVPNRDQRDLNENGIGDDCETNTPGGAGAGDEPRLPAIAFIVPVTGGLHTLICADGSSLALLRLPNGDLVRFQGLCTAQAGLEAVDGTSLPSPLPQDTLFISGMNTTVSVDGMSLPILPQGASLQPSFIIPAEFAGRDLAILFWNPDLNGGVGGWVELALAGDGASYPLTLNPEGTQNRLQLSGTALDGSNSRFETETNFTGLFVLVAK